MLTKSILAFLRNRAGNATLIVALSAVPLFGAAGIAIDTYRHMQAQAHLQAALDAGALAGASTINATNEGIEQVIREFASANGIDEVIDPEKDLVVTFRSSGAIHVRAEGAVNTTLGNVLGISSLRIWAETEVMAGRTGAEVALVVDTTGSMNSGGKIEALRNAARDFVNIISETNDNTGGDTINVSIVPYAQYVNVGTQYKGAAWMDPVNESGGNVWRGCVGSREYPNNITDNSYGDGVPPIMNINCAQPVEPLTSDKAKLIGRIAGLTGNGMTYIPAGLVWGWRSLSAIPPFDQGVGPTEADTKGIRKYVVLMTDGDNTVRKLPGSPHHTSSGPGNISQTADNLTLELCDRIKAEAITIFSIAFQVSSGSTRNMLRKCATNSQNYYDADDPAQLSAAFNAIGAKVAAVRLSR